LSHSFRFVCDVDLVWTMVWNQKESCSPVPVPCVSRLPPVFLNSSSPQVWSVVVFTVQCGYKCMNEGYPQASRPARPNSACMVDALCSISIRGKGELRYVVCTSPLVPLPEVSLGLSWGMAGVRLGVIRQLFGGITDCRALGGSRVRNTSRSHFNIPAPS
jgi:hypothetical protein